jgi:solute carrier family 15 (oligopeptide transporter), member 1
MTFMDLFRVLVNLPNDQKVTLQSKGVPDKTFSSKSHELVTLPHGNYEIFVSDKLINIAKLSIGGVYTMVLNANSTGNINSEVHIITVPNSVNMLWLLPQYIIITAGEVS